MAFQSFELTNEGINLLAQVQAELGSLNFTQIKIGDGDYTGDIKDLTDIISEFHNFPVTSTQVQPDSSVKIQAPFTNETFTQAYTWREIGIYAKLGDTGVEILYSYSKDPTPDTIPSYDGGANIYRRTLDIRNYISDVDSVTLEIVELTNKYDFNTVAEMQAASYIVDGDRIKLWGYYALGDGGGHERIFSLTDDGTGIPFNGGFAIIPNGTKQINIKWFGAVGDGLTDDTEYFRKMFSKRASYVLDSGTYLVGSDISDYSIFEFREIEDIEFIGVNNPKIIISETCDSNICFSFDWCSGITFNNISFFGIPNQDISTQEGIILIKAQSNSDRLTITNCEFSDSASFVISDCTNSYINPDRDDNRITGTKVANSLINNNRFNRVHGAYITKAGGVINAILSENIVSSSVNGFKLDSESDSIHIGDNDITESVIISSNVFKNINGLNASETGALQIEEGLSEVLINGNVFDGFSGDAVPVRINSGQSIKIIKTLTITNNTINNVDSDASGVFSCSFRDVVENLTISNNIMTNIDTNIMYLRLRIGAYIWNLNFNNNIIDVLNSGQSHTLIDNEGTEYKLERMVVSDYIQESESDFFIRCLDGTNPSYRNLDIIGLTIKKNIYINQSYFLFGSLDANITISKSEINNSGIAVSSGELTVLDTLFNSTQIILSGNIKTRIFRNNFYNDYNNIINGYYIRVGGIDLSIEKKNNVFDTENVNNEFLIVDGDTSLVLDVAGDRRCVLGTSANRPIGGYEGQQYYDTTLNKPIWWNGTVWIDATGTPI